MKTPVCTTDCCSQLTERVMQVIFINIPLPWPLLVIMWPIDLLPDMGIAAVSGLDKALCRVLFVMIERNSIT